MQPKHKKYILENIDKKSPKEISRTLNLKEKKIKRFLEKEKEKKKSQDYQKEGFRQVKKKTLLVSIALIIILGFAVYSNSLNGEFFWDDGVLVKNNVYIKSSSHILKIFAKDIGAGAGKGYSFYRPLQMLTYMFDYSFWKLNVKGYHLSNILLHILVALAIFWLINILYHNWLLSLFTSLFFIVHPVHTEAVAYISGRSDSLAAIFMLLSFIFYIKGLHTKSKTYYFLMLLSYILALLSRENSLFLPPLLLLYHYSFKQRPNSKQFLPIVSLAFIYILLRFTVLKFLLSYTPSDTTFFQRLPGFFVAITNYIRLIFLPFNLHMEYGKKMFSLAHPQVILGMLIFFFLLIYVIKTRKTHGLISFSISWFFITLLPSSNLYPINAYMAEHWLYLPSVGLFLILAKGLNFLYKTQQFKMPTIVLTISLLSFYSYLTTRQNNYWREPISFYKRTLRYAPDSPRMYYNLGNTYRTLGKNEQATSSYKKAIQLKPNYADAYNNLGVTYRTLGKNEQATTSYKKAIQLNPDYADPYYNLAVAYHDFKRDDEAIALLKKAIQLNPDYAKAYNNLGNAYRDLGKNEQAITLYKKAIQLNPDYALAYNNLSIAYFHQEQYKLAIEYCDKARKLGFNNPAFFEALRPYRK